MSHPTVALVGIVRDEERQLPGLLSSVQGAVDAVLLADTGSADQTVRVARHMGAEVVEHDWPDSFAAARNRVLELANRRRWDWLLVLDADDRLTLAGRRTVRQLSRAPLDERLIGYVLEIEERDRSGRVFGHTPSSLRLFRNDPALRYRGLVHEEIVDTRRDTDTRSVGLPDGGPHIRHLGYDRELYAQRNKSARNLKLLLQRMLEDPHDAYAAYYLARQYVRDGEPAEAARWAQIGLALRERLQPEHSAWLRQLASAEPPTISWDA